MAHVARVAMGRATVDSRLVFAFHHGMRERGLRPRRALGCAILAIVLLVVGACPGPADAGSARPRITVSPETQDLGVVALGEEATAEIRVGNEGDAALEVNVRVLPRGLHLEGLAPVVPPGSSILVRVRIDTARAEPTGRQVLSFVTNDPSRPRVAVTVQLEIRPFLLVRPGYARYITVQRAQEGTITQLIGAADGALFRVLRADSPLPSLRVSFREARPDEREPAWPGSQWLVAMTLASEAPVGALTGAVVVHTDHPRQRRTFVPLSGFVRPILAVTPPQARLGDLDRRHAVPVELLVKNFAEEPFEITSVSTDVTAVRAVIVPVEAGRAWHLRLIAEPAAPLGPFQGVLRLHTASPALPALEVPLSGRIVDGAKE